MPVDKSNDRVRRMFGEIAPRYDMMNHVLSLNADRYWRWRTVRLAAPSGSDPILDVCTGTGDLAFAYHRKTSGKTPIVAADFCAEMLRVGRAKRRSARDAGHLLFVEADTQHLPFADNQFQLVTVAFGLRNVADTQRGLREMVRVCRPTGAVAILEFSTPQWQPFRSIYSWYFRHVLPRLGQWLAANRQNAYNYLPESVREFPEGEALVEQLRLAGLERIRRIPFTWGVATLYLGNKPAVQVAERRT